MATKNTVELDFKVVSNQAVKGLNDINKSVKEVGKQVSTTKLVMANLAGAAIIGGFKLIGKGFSAMAGAMSEAIDLAKIQEDAINDLNTALKGSGKYSIEASQDLQNYASELQKTSIFGDEAILSAQALGVQMAKLSGQDLKDATLAAANMASAVGVDLNTAMRMLAKSATDNGSGLKRHGITVEKGATAQETLANAIKATNEQFAGAAAGKIETYSGAMKQASNSFGDMQEEMGKIVTDSPAMIAIIKTLNGLWVDLGGYVKENAKVMQAWIQDGVLLVIESLKAMVPYINPVINAFKFMGRAIGIVVDVIQTQFFAFQTISAGIWLAIVATIKDAIGALPSFLVPDGWVEGLEEAETKIKGHMESMATSTKENALEAIDGIGNIGTAFENTVSDEVLENITTRLDTMTESVIAQSEKVVEVKTKEQLALEELAKQQAEADKKQELIDKKAQDKKDKEELKRKERIAKEEQAIRKKQDEQFKFYDKAKQKWEKSTWDERINDTSAGFDALSTLSTSHNKTMAAVGKTAAIINTTMRTYQSATAAFSAMAGIPYVGPALGAAAAAAAVAAGLANVAKIKSAPSFQDGGIVPGTSFTGDNVPAYVNSREMILNDGQQANLFAIANGANISGNSELLGAIQSLGDRIGSMEVILNVDSYEIARATQAGIDSGFNLKVG